LRRARNGSIYSNADMYGSKGPLETVGQISREKSRTILAVVTASVISLVVWGLVVALNIR
jgi:hypothetical protein